MDVGFGSIVSLVFLVLVVLTLKAGIKIVPQSENWLVERLGKFNRKLEAGLHLIIPFFESVRYKVPIQERQLPPKPINAITLDNVTISVSLAVLYRIVDASRTMYRISNVDDAILTIVNGTVRNVIGKTDLDGVQSNRRNLSEEISNDLDTVSLEWGIALTRVEILEVDVDPETKQAMQLQLNAERNRRARVREAEGQKEATQLQADAELYAAEKKRRRARSAQTPRPTRCRRSRARLPMAAPVRSSLKYANCRPKRCRTWAKARTASWCSSPPMWSAA